MTRTPQPVDFTKLVCFCNLGELRASPNYKEWRSRRPPRSVISARVLCVCVWPKLRSRNINSTKKMGIFNPNGQAKSVFLYQSNIKNHFSLKLSSFGELQVLDRCWGAFVCVYDQNYALVIVTQPKKEEFPIQLARISQCSFLIKIYKTIFVWNCAVLEN